MFNLYGIYAPIPTPFEGGEIAYDKLKANVQYWTSTDLSGLVVMGSNGEFVLLDQDEKERLIGSVCEYTEGKKWIIAGTGAESTRETIRLSNRAAELGAHAALIITPNYYKRGMNDNILKQYYFEVAEKSKLPVILYNMPGNSGINMTTKLVTELSVHPNIIGIKDSGGNIVQISEIINNTADDFVMFAGSASFLLTSLVMGAKGGTLALANILPNECAKLQKLVEAGDYVQAKELQMNLLDINAAVTSRYGIGGLKAAMEMVGLYGGDPRPPLKPLGEADREELKKILLKTGFVAEDAIEAAATREF